MDKPYRSPVRPLLSEGESLLGYLKRFTELLRVPRLSAVATILDLPCDLRKLPSHEELCLIVDSLGLPSDAVDQFALWRTGKGKVAYKNWTLPRYLLRIDHPRFCPACLAEGGFHRSAWNFAFVNHCAKHGLTLLSDCQHCGAKATWNTAGVSACSHCRAKFSSMAAPAAPERYTAAIGCLLDIVEGHAPSSSIHADLAAFTFSQTIELILLVGRMEAERHGFTPGKGRPLTWAHADELLAFGLESARNLPKAMEGLVACKLRLAGANGINVRDALGSFYRPIRAIQRLPLPRKTLEELAAAVPECELKVGKPVGRRALGLSRDAFYNLRKLPGWSGLRIGGSGVPDAGAVEKMKSDLRSVCTLCQAGQLLGVIGKKQLKQIADSGIFSEVPEELQLDTRARYLFRAEIESLIRELECAAAAGNPESRTVSWRELRLMGRERDLSLPQVLQIVMSRKLVPVAKRDGVGLQSFLFDRSAAVVELDRVRTEKVESLSARQVADELQVTLRVAYALMQRKMLPTTAMGSEVEQKVTARDFKQFKHEFVSLNEVAAKVGSTARCLRAKIVGAMPSQDLLRFEKDGVQFCRRDRAAELGYQ